MDEVDHGKSTDEVDNGETSTETSISAPAQEYHLGAVADIVAAYVSNNSIRYSELPDLIAAVHQALTGVQTGTVTETEQQKREPLVSVKKSLGNGEYLISMLDGKQYKSLKRHLGTHNFTPEEYRRVFNLPSTYPMVAPAYSAKRSELARAIGLGNFKSDDDAQKPAKAPNEPKEPGKRGRPRKNAA